MTIAKKSSADLERRWAPPSLPSPEKVLMETLEPPTTTRLWDTHTNFKLLMLTISPFMRHWIKPSVQLTHGDRFRIDDAVYYLNANTLIIAMVGSKTFF